jgi:cytochrome c oxidase subunit 2
MATGNGGGVWMPPAASTAAGEVDALFDFIYWISVISFIGVVAATVYFVRKYRRKTDDQLAVSQIGHNTLVEAAWTFVPLVLVMVMFVWGFRLFMSQQVAPTGSYEISVAGEKWRWVMTYPDGHISVNELHVPANRPVKLLLSSRDVIHSFFVPDFRVKQDAVPGRYTTLWFEAKAPGKHQIFCTEYCGTGHSAMLADVIVHTDEAWQKIEQGQWPGDGPKAGEKPEDWGKALFTKFTCNACHTIDGSAKVGPTLKGIFGKDEKIKDGGTIKVDENYLRESITDPQAKIVEGFAPSMPAFKGQISDAQMDALIAYLKTL